MAGTGPLLFTGAKPPPTMVTSGVRPVPQKPEYPTSLLVHLYLTKQSLGQNSPVSLAVLSSTRGGPGVSNATLRTRAEHADAV